MALDLGGTSDKSAAYVLYLVYVLRLGKNAKTSGNKDKVTEFLHLPPTHTHQTTLHITSLLGQVSELTVNSKASQTSTMTSNEPADAKAHGTTDAAHTGTTPFFDAFQSFMATASQDDAAMLRAYLATSPTASQPQMTANDAQPRDAHPQVDEGPEGTTTIARHNNTGSNADAENNNYASNEESESSCLSDLERWATGNRSTNKTPADARGGLPKGSYAARVVGPPLTLPPPRAGGTDIFDNINAQRDAYFQDHQQQQQASKTAAALATLALWVKWRLPRDLVRKDPNMDLNHDDLQNMMDRILLDCGITTARFLQPHNVEGGAMNEKGPILMGYIPIKPTVAALGVFSVGTYGRNNTNVF